MSKLLVTSVAPSLLVTASAAVLLCGCGSPDDMTAQIVPARQSEALAGAVEPGSAMAAPGAVAPSNVAVSPRQRGYLDALASAGVSRSSDLQALSIGSYVCQGRAAGQSDQAVWDFVYPLVRNDVMDVLDRDGADAEPLVSAEETTARYIHIATDRLC